MHSVSQPLSIIDGTMPKLVRSKSDSTKMVTPIAEINSSDIAVMQILKNLKCYFSLWRLSILEFILKRLARKTSQLVRHEN